MLVCVFLLCFFFSYAAGSQFLTHTTGRILSALHPISTPINTAGYSKLLQVVEQTQKDSWELYQGLYKYNAKSQEQLEKFATVFEQLRAKLKAGISEESSSGSSSGGSSGSVKSDASAVSFNPSVLRMNESKTAAVADLTKVLVGSGVPVVSLSVGEVLSVKTPQPIIDATIAALQAGHTTYTATNGILALREAICAKLQKENGLSYTPDQILVSNGAKQSIFQALSVLVVPGCEDEVLIPSPYWVSYPDMATLVGGRPVIVETRADQGWILTAQQLEQAITPRTKVLILCSPSNPTGAVYTLQQLQALAQVLERHPNIHVLSDEIYEHLLFSSSSAANAPAAVAVHHSFAGVSPSMFRRTVTINGFSKGYVMTGFRVGYIACGNTELTRLANKVQGQVTSCASSLSQHAALAALTKLGPEFRASLVHTLSVTRGLLLQALRAIPNLSFVEPQGAFYVLIDCSAYFGGKGKDGRIIQDRYAPVHNAQAPVAVAKAMRMGARRTEHSRSLVRSCSVCVLCSDSLCVYLLEQYRVALVPGSAFGAPNCLRISYASSDEIVMAGVKAISSALQEITL